MNQKKITGTLETALIWLSASDLEVLKTKCPKWEKIKYEAFGASVLVPVFFGMIASTYAVSTLTSNWFVIGIFALVWGFIILTIDRVLLSTYRAFVPKSKKYIQFVLRISVAILMGLTVSHPLTLLLFKDTISSEIEKERTSEMLAARQKTDSDKETLENRIKAAGEQLAIHQRKYQDTVSGEFLNTPPPPVVVPTPETDSRFADIDSQIGAYKDERDQVRHDLEKWQETYDAEVRGVRSGKSGIGPNARAIERDHLIWRREEIKRLNGVIGGLAARRTELSSEVMSRTLAVSASLQESRRDLEKQKIAMFTNNQGPLLKVIKGQIDSTTAELADLRRDASQLATDTSDRVANLKVEKRADLMAQTNMLHKMFKSPAAGGTFALVVYIVLVLLFTLIDTIPLVVKFCTVPGLYDKYLYYKENSVRAINENIDDNFSKDMKKRDFILHGLLNYDPDADKDIIYIDAEPKLLATKEAFRLPGNPVEEIITPVKEEIAPVKEEIALVKEEIRALNDEKQVAADESDFVVDYGNGGEALEGSEIREKRFRKTGPTRRTAETSFPVEAALNSDPAEIEKNDFSGLLSIEPFRNENRKQRDTEFVTPVTDESHQADLDQEEVDQAGEVPPLWAGHVYNDEPEMLEPGFGASIFDENSNISDFDTEEEFSSEKAKEAPRSQNMKSIRHHLDEPVVTPGVGQQKAADSKESSHRELDLTQPNLKNGKKVQKAAGGVLMPVNGSRKSNR